MTVEQEEHIPIYLVTEQKAMNGPIVAIECVSSCAAQILHCHPFRPIQSNHRINANGRFELISGLDVNNLWSRKTKQKKEARPVCQNFSRGAKSLQSKAAMDLCIHEAVYSLTIKSEPWIFPDWNECRVSLEQDNSLSPDFKLLLFICHVRYEYTGSM